VFPLRKNPDDKMDTVICVIQDNEEK